MKLAFATGAIASGVTAAGLTTLVIWIATALTRSSEPWDVAPWIVAVVAAAFGIGTYLAERIAYARSLARMRATGEPWAFRE